MAATAREAGVAIVTGDTKVVERGACDKLFITTAGIGVIRARHRSRRRPGAAGRRGDRQRPARRSWRGDPGRARRPCAGDARSRATAQPLHGLVAALLAACPGHALPARRDARRRRHRAERIRRQRRGSGSRSTRPRLPMREEVKGFCEILGLDPLYLANEGKLVAVVPADEARRARWRRCARIRSAREAAIIGDVTRGRARPGDDAAPRSAASASSTCWSASNCRGSAEGRHARTGDRLQHRRQSSAKPRSGRAGAAA